MIGPLSRFQRSMKLERRRGGVGASVGAGAGLGAGVEETCGAVVAEAGRSLGRLRDGERSERRGADEDDQDSHGGMPDHRPLFGNVRRRPATLVVDRTRAPLARPLSTVRARLHCATTPC